MSLLLPADGALLTGDTVLGRGTTVIAEIPGVDREKIELHADHERLSIKAESGKGVFSKLVTFPTKVDPVSATARYNNGVLEIAFKRSNTYKSVVKIDVM